MRAAYKLRGPAGNAQPSRLRPHLRRAYAFWLRQRRALRSGDARTASSATLALVAIAALLGYALLPGNAAVSNAPVNRLAEAGPRAPVRILDQTPRGESCDEQVWPYIAQNCLKGTAAPAPAPATTGAAPQQSAAVPATPQPAQTQTAQTNAAPVSAAPEKQASLSVPDSAGARAGQMEYVPLPVPRPQDQAALEQNDADMPPWAARRYGPDGRYSYGPDGRGDYYGRQSYSDQQYVNPRELRRAQRHERRARRHGIHIGGFHFRF